MNLRKEIITFWLIDLVLVCLAWWMSFWLRFNFEIPDQFVKLAFTTAGWMAVCFVVGLGVAKVSRQTWRYIGLPELRQLAWGILVAGVLSATVVLMLRFQNFPRSVLLLHPLIALVLLGAVRAGWRTLTEHSKPAQGSRPLLIVGSLKDAADALRAFKGSSHCTVLVSHRHCRQSRAATSIKFPFSVCQMRWLKLQGRRVLQPR